MINITCVCERCKHHNKDNFSLEINFSDKKFYFVCSECKKMNMMEVDAVKSKPLPKIRTL